MLVLFVLGGHAPIVAKAVRHKMPISRLFIYECLEEVVGFGDVCKEAGGVAELREGGARKQFISQRGDDALGRLPIRFVVVSNIFGEFDWPLVYSSCTYVLLTNNL